MSLHASSVPANDNAVLRSHDSVPELHRQLQFQEEERKMTLKKLIETDKEKVKRSFICNSCVIFVTLTRHVVNVT